jgi:hypothetical protein
LNSSSDGLDEERHAISSDEYFREPLQSNYRVSLTVNYLDDASEDHVYGGSEERWRDQDE